MPDYDYKKLQEAVTRNKQTLKRVRNLLKDLEDREEKTAAEVKVPSPREKQAG